VFTLSLALGMPLAGLRAQNQTQPQATAQTTPPPAPPATAAPDYPDPRTLTVGIFYWATGPGTNPGLWSGRKALDFATLPDLGKPHRSPGAEISFPISRTGSLHAEFFQTKGVGNQTLTTAPDLFSTQFAQGDLLATQFQIRSVKLYLDDLLFPHKFPVSRFRLKSLWGAQFVKDYAVIDKIGATGFTGRGTKQVLLPSIGMAAEYAIAPHLLFRLDGSGFGLYHKSDIWDASATLAWRRGRIEIVGGAKAFHFKTSPNTDEYMTATLTGGFVGVRYHWR
jgi:hypothetical protein